MARQAAEICAGVAGAGGIGSVHLREFHIAGIKRLCIAGRGIDSASRAAARFSEQFERPVEAVNSIEALGDSVDFVSICTPNARHLEHARILLNRNCHVLVEKPIFWTENLTRARVADICASIFDEAAGRLAVNHPTEHFAETYNAACGVPKEVTDFSFCYQTRGNYHGDEIAVDLLPHAFSLLLAFRPREPLSLLSRHSSRDEWRATFRVGNTNCRFEFLRDPKADNSSLSFAVNGQRAKRIQIADETGFKVFLDIPGASVVPVTMTNPMSSSIRAALNICLDGGVYCGQQDRTQDIMCLLADTLLE